MGCARVRLGMARGLQRLLPRTTYPRLARYVLGRERSYMTMTKAMRDALKSNRKPLDLITGDRKAEREAKRLEEKTQENRSYDE